MKWSEYTTPWWKEYSGKLYRRGDIWIEFWKKGWCLPHGKGGKNFQAEELSKQNYMKSRNARGFLWGLCIVPCSGRSGESHAIKLYFDLVERFRKLDKVLRQETDTISCWKRRFGAWNTALNVLEVIIRSMRGFRGAPEKRGRCSTRDQEDLEEVDFELSLKNRKDSNWWRWGGKVFQVWKKWKQARTWSSYIMFGLKK